jgi:hypothetical protein
MAANLRLLSLASLVCLRLEPFRSPAPFRPDCNILETDSKAIVTAHCWCSTARLPYGKAVFTQPSIMIPPWLSVCSFCITNPKPPLTKLQFFHASVPIYCAHCSWPALSPAMAAFDCSINCRNKVARTLLAPNMCRHNLLLGTELWIATNVGGEPRRDNQQISTVSHSGIVLRFASGHGSVACGTRVVLYRYVVRCTLYARLKCSTAGATSPLALTQCCAGAATAT